MTKHIFYLVIPIILLGILPATGCGQTGLKSNIVIKDRKKGYLGVEVRDVDKRLMEKKDLKIDYGAYVDKVVEDSPAEEAGIEKGDVIIEINGKRVDDAEDLTVAVRKIKPKTEVRVNIIRKGEKKSIPVVIGKMKSLDNFYTFRFNDNIIQLNKGIKKLKIPVIYSNVDFKTLVNLNGLQVESMTKQLGEFFGAPDGKGVLVTEVKKGSNADKAGFKAGDVIVKVDKYKIENLDDFNDQISDLEDSGASVEVIRGGKTVTLKIDFEVEEDTEDDEDSEWSFYGITPPDPPCIEIVPEPVLRMDIIKSHICEFRNNFKNNFRLMKEKLTDYLRNL